MISIMDLVLVISIGFLVPKAAGQSDNIRKWHLSTKSCRKNAYDSDKLDSELRRYGIEPIAPLP
jgi:uncharacterized membrane protein YcaP (DUF421 family)